MLVYTTFPNEVNVNYILRRPECSSKLLLMYSSKPCGQPIKFIKLSAEDVLDKRPFQNTEEKEQQ